MVAKKHARKEVAIVSRFNELRSTIKKALTRVKAVKSTSRKMMAVIPDNELRLCSRPGGAESRCRTDLRVGAGGQDYPGGACRDGETVTLTEQKIAEMKEECPVRQASGDLNESSWQRSGRKRDS